MLGKCDRNARRAANMYATTYPERRHPCRKMFCNIEKCARVHGVLERTKRSKRKTVTNDDNAIIALAHFEKNPYTSIRSVATDTGLSTHSINRITKKNNYHTYKIRKVQQLRVIDEER